MFVCVLILCWLGISVFGYSVLGMLGGVGVFVGVVGCVGELVEYMVIGMVDDVGVFEFC